MALIVKDYPLLVFLITLITLWLAEWLGSRLLFQERVDGDRSESSDSVIQGSVLTLLALLIGFSFAMAVNRYDLRKNYEEAEANAIGTEFLRAGFLPDDDAEKARNLLRLYLDQRLRFYTIRDATQLQHANALTSALQEQLWNIVQRNATSQPNVVLALVAVGMNDVLNSEGYTQAAWWNRIPSAAWLFMLMVAICSNVLIGYAVRKSHSERRMLFVLPLVVAASFMLIADIDSPRGGLIRVDPHNLIRLAESIRVQ